MFETFRRIRGSMLFGSAGSLALGTALLLIPDLFLQVACYVLGALLIASGVLSVLGSLRADGVRFGGLRLGAVLACAVLVGAGIFVISQPRAISSILPIVVGLLLLFDGALNIRQGLGLRGFGDRAAMSVLVLGVITVVLGAAILLNPYSTAALTLRLTGAALVYSGLSDLVIVFRMNRASKTYEANRRVIDVETRPVEEEEDP
ncbi:MAG TPA: DUF308 domain-containing protein [Candidatus Butyricicoccus stercorigallinarum]|nr:DUF308 domain-containing protein [Candidatus Butyricicoccus stercorigallinarum]